VFNKADLANEQLFPRIRDLYEGVLGFQVVFTSADKGTNTAEVLRAVDRALELSDAATSRRRTAATRFRQAGALMMVVGLPNVGKSTLINALRNNARAGGGAAAEALGAGAKTGAEAGVTRGLRTLLVRPAQGSVYFGAHKAKPEAASTSGVSGATGGAAGSSSSGSGRRLRQTKAKVPLYLVDSPGVMPPRILDVETGMKLAVTTSLKGDSAAIPWSAQAEYLLYYFASIKGTRWMVHPTLGLEAFVHPPTPTPATATAPVDATAPKAKAKTAGKARAVFPPDRVEEFLEIVAQRLGAVAAGGGWDREAAARHFVRLFQAGKLGRYTLDFVPVTKAEIAAAKAAAVIPAPAVTLE
jgi:hypothetical protein